MKKSLLILGILLAVGFGVSAATTQTITLNGSVGQDVSIGLTDDGVTFDLNVAETDAQAGTLSYSANTGFSITAASGGTFAFTSGTVGDTRPYTLKVGGTLVSDGSAYIGTAGTGDLIIAISYTADTLIAEASDYTDDVTFTIAAQ